MSQKCSSFIHVREKKPIALIHVREKKPIALIHGREKKSWHSSMGGNRVFWAACRIKVVRQACFDGGTEQCWKGDSQSCYLAR